MSEQEIRNCMKLTDDLRAYQHFEDYIDKLCTIKKKIFNQVLSRLDSFERVILEHKPFIKDNVYSDDFFLLDDLFLQLSSDEIDFLRKYKNDEI